MTLNFEYMEYIVLALWWLPVSHDSHKIWTLKMWSKHDVPNLIKLDWLNFLSGLRFTSKRTDYKRDSPNIKTDISPKTQTIFLYYVNYFLDVTQNKLM